MKNKELKKMQIFSKGFFHPFEHCACLMNIHKLYVFSSDNLSCNVLCTCIYVIQNLGFFSSERLHMGRLAMVCVIMI